MFLCFFLFSKDYTIDQCSNLGELSESLVSCVYKSECSGVVDFPLIWEGDIQVYSFANKFMFLFPVYVLQSTCLGYFENSDLSNDTQVPASCLGSYDTNVFGIMETGMLLF